MSKTEYRTPGKTATTITIVFYSAYFNRDGWKSIWFRDATRNKYEHGYQNPINENEIFVLRCDDWPEITKVEVFTKVTRISGERSWHHVGWLSPQNMVAKLDRVRKRIAKKG